MNVRDFFASCPKGLEYLLVDELKALGASDVHEALAGAPMHGVPVPDGIVTVRISPVTGLLASADNPNGIMEKFMEDNLPKSELYEGSNSSNPMSDGDKPIF